MNKTLDIAGPQAYTTQEIIGICERLADTDAKTRNIPVWLLKGTRSILRSLQWAGDAADRLAFAEVLAGNENFSAPMHDTYRLLGVEPGSVTTVEAYLKVGRNFGERCVVERVNWVVVHMERCDVWLSEGMRGVDQISEVTL